jgi:hypothetical protein
MCYYILLCYSGLHDESRAALQLKKQCHISFLTCVTFVADVRYAHPVLLNWPALAQPSAYKYV